MKRVFAFSWNTCAALLAVHVLGSGVARGQTDVLFTLSVESPATLSGSAASTQSATIYTRLKHEGNPPGNGAQGWSYGIAVENCLITSLTVAGTLADTIPNGGYRDPEGSFNKTQIIDPAKNAGTNGIVSAIALTTQGLEEAVLPSGADGRILQMGLEAMIPTGEGTATLEFREGLIGSGQPVAIVVTQDGISANFATVPAEIRLVEVQSCCDDGVNMGFSEAVIKSGPVLPDATGVLGVGPLCIGDEGEAVAFSGLGATGVKRVHSNIISNLAEGSNVQGWSYGLALDGSAQVTSVTVAGTSADSIPNGGYRDPEGSFNKTQIIDPAKNAGQKGLVSAIALTTQGLEEAILPSVGTQSVLSFDITAGEPQGEADQVNSLRYQGGLVGSGQPVALVVTVGGESAVVCNFELAQVDVIFRKSQIAQFTRGNANNDTKVDIADGIWIINELVRSGPVTLCQDAADANDDGTVDVSDAVYLIQWQFQPSTAPNPDPPPPPPLDECGPDPTDDTVGCAESQSSCS
jgi:hypothetical protein